MFKKLGRTLLLNARLGIFFGSLMVFLVQDSPLFSASTDGLVFGLTVGKIGTITELIYSPHTGKPTNDPFWIYDYFPNGTKNPNYPPLPASASLPLQDGVPSGLGDGIPTFQGFSNPTLIHAIGKDTDHSSQEVLIPEITLLVNASLPWVKTGFFVTSGQTFYIQASGKWSNHFDQMWCGPDGHPGIMPSEPKPGHLPMPLPTGCMGLLVGRIGIGGEGFPVGNGGVFTAVRAGEVQLMCNDALEGPEGYTPGPCCIFCQNNGFVNSHLGNNQGSLTVTLSLNPIK